MTDPHPQQRYRAFVSHTAELARWPAQRSCVQAALDAVSRAGYAPGDMRYFGPDARPPADVCVDAVLNCQVYVAVIGFRYGSMVPGRGISYTELEFETAVKAGLPRLIVLLAEPPTGADLVDTDRTLIDEFRRRLCDSGSTVSFARTADQVELHVYQGLQSPHLLTSLPPIGWRMAGPEGAGGVRAHVRQRGQGQRSVARGGDHFRGRVEALSVIREWLTAGAVPGRVRVVTGQPGAGKSAVVARAALELEQDPGQAGRYLGVWFHARSAALIDLLNVIAIATRTVTAGSVGEMVERIRDVAPPAGSDCWRLVVDALDEAATDRDRSYLAEALVELASLGWRVVVATRPLSPDRDRWFVPGALFSALGIRDIDDPALVDLDSDRFFDEADLVEFVTATLTQDDALSPGPPDGAWRQYRSDATLCRRLASVIAQRAGRNHLVALLTADRLSRDSAAVDPDDPGFSIADLPTSVGEALDKYIDDPRRTELDRAHVRGLLTALAYARGDGIDDDRWLSFAAALGYPASVANIDALRASPAADYLLESSTVDGQRLTRLFHQALADQLQGVRSREQDERRILDRLLPAAPGDWEVADSYARRFAADHAAAAGQLSTLLTETAFLTACDLARLMPLLPDEAGPTPTSGRRDLASTILLLRLVAPQAQRLGPTRRAGLFELAATQAGWPAADRPHRPGNLRISWAHRRGSAHQTLALQRGCIDAMAVTHLAGRDLVLAASEDVVTIWDAATRTPVRELATGHRDAITSIKVTDIDGTVVAVTGSCDGTVRLWDMTTGQPWGRPQTYDSEVWSVDLARAAGQVLAVAGCGDGSIRVWDLATGRRGNTVLRVGHGSRRHRRAHNVVADVLAVSVLDADGRLLVIAATNDDRVCVWDMGNGRQRPESVITCGQGAVHSMVAGSINGTHMVITGGADGTVRVWDPLSGRPIGAAIRGHDGEVGAVAVAHLSGRQLIASAGADSTVRLWDATDHQPVGAPLLGHDGLVSALVPAHIGGRGVLVSGGSDGTVRLWDATADQEDHLVGHGGTVNTLAIATVDGRSVVLSGSSDGTVRMWDRTTGLASGPTLVGHDDEVLTVTAARVGREEVILSGGFDETAQIWNPVNGRAQGSVVHRHGTVYAVATTKIGGVDIIATGHTNGSIRLWDPAAHRPFRQPLTGHDGPVRAMLVANVDGRDLIVSGGADGTVRVWDPETGQPMGEPMTGHDGPIITLASTTIDGQRVLVTGSHDATVRLWNLATGQLFVDPLRGHQGSVLAVAATSIGGRNLILSGGDDRTIRLWDVGDGGQLLVQDTLDAVHAIAADGATVFFSAGVAVVAATIEQVDE